METFSLWLTPAGEVSEQLAALIRRLSLRHGAPAFPPHITLLGSLTGRRHELISRCECLAASLRPFVIRLGEVAHRDEYFRCLFIRAALDQPLRQAQRAACQALGVKRQPAFMPHLSLLYGLFPGSVKEQIIAGIGTRLDLQFKVRCLQLYRTHDDPPKWRQVARFGLK